MIRDKRRLPLSRAGPMLPRRRVLQAAVACLAGAAPLGIAGTLAAAILPATPRQTAGPFYPISIPLDSDNDLVHVAGRSAPASGTVTQITGQVLDRNGGKLAGAQIEIWQCDANGRYRHPGDTRNGRTPDGNFQGYGRTVTDRIGRYQFLTIRPVPYPGRTPHIHFAVSGRGFEPFVTQMYVAGEPENERDPLLLGVGDPAARARLVVALAPAPEIAPHALAGRFDIVIGHRAG